MMGRIIERYMIMTHSHRSILAAFMAIVLVAGSVGLATAGLQDCLPKACCCMKGGHEAAPHKREIDTKSGCTGNAPCCQIEPAHKTRDIAALTARPELPEAKALFQATIPGQPFTAHPTPASARTFQHAGKPRAPLVPRYLETQMILC